MGHLGDRARPGLDEDGLDGGPGVERTGEELDPLDDEYPLGAPGVAPAE
jgi:hypothetical protein